MQCQMTRPSGGEEGESTVTNIKSQVFIFLIMTRNSSIGKKESGVEGVP